MIKISKKYTIKPKNKDFVDELFKQLLNRALNWDNVLWDTLSHSITIDGLKFKIKYNKLILSYDHYLDSYNQYINPEYLKKVSEEGHSISFDLGFSKPCHSSIESRGISNI
jgi:hypothetical protein